MSSKAKGRLTVERIVLPLLVLASVHKSLRFCDLCKELGFGYSCAHNALGAGSAS
jgi:hypothetical protein